MRRQALLLAVAPALVFGCGGGEARTAAGPELALVDSLVLRESDTLFIGRPRDFSVDARDGTFFVSDGYANRVVRYDRRGDPVQSYGHRGSGPGEFVQVGKIFVADSLLLVADPARGTLNVFRRATGEYLNAIRDPGILGTGASVGAGMVLGAQSLDRGTSLARWTPGRDTLARIGELPPEYHRSQPLAGIFNGIHPSAWADTLLVGFAASPDLLLLTPQGKVVERIHVPAVLRKGVPEHLGERLEKMEFQEMFSSTSVLFAVRRLTGGDFALVHYDQVIDDAGNIVAKLYVSLLSRDRTRVCTDRLLPTSPDVQPRTSMRGDTLFVLEQRVDGQAAVTYVKSYRISANGCHWSPTRRLPG